MADIPEHLTKEHVLEVQRFNELTLDWDGWPSEYDGDDARKRRVIKRRIEETNFAINAFEVNKDSLADFEIEDQDLFESDAVIDGICFARAYYDGTSRTGIIKAGNPIAFDTVTGKCVTGVNAVWQPNEYTVVGTALTDYAETTAEGEDIPVKLSSVGVQGEEGTGVLLYTDYRLPGRYLYDGEKIAGQFSAKRVRIEVATTYPKRYKMVTTDETVTLLYPGRRDVRPHMYVWAQKLSQSDAPEADMYIATAAFYE